MTIHNVIFVYRYADSILNLLLYVNAMVKRDISDYASFLTLVIVFRRIIFANPSKMASQIRYAASVGVDIMTVDSEAELIKIKENMPYAQ